MKRLAIVFAVLFVFSASAYAQMGMMGGATSGEQKGEMTPCGMMMSEEQQMPMCQQMMKEMMPMCQQMMMGQNMMMKDMMKIQQKMMRGLSPLEKKEITKELETMIRNMDKMMSEMRGMMMQEMTGPAQTGPKKEEQKKDAPTKEGTPKNDPHKH